MVDVSENLGWKGKGRKGADGRENSNAVFQSINQSPQINIDGIRKEETTKMAVVLRPIKSVDGWCFSFLLSPTHTPNPPTPPSRALPFQISELLQRGLRRRHRVPRPVRLDVKGLHHPVLDHGGEAVCVVDKWVS